MKGYKILLNNMKSPIAGMKYEVGKEYEIEEINLISSNPELWGFHFYKSLFLGICSHFLIYIENDVNVKLQDFRVFEIDSPDDECAVDYVYRQYSPYDITLKSTESIVCTKKIKLIREINIDEIREIIAKELLINLGFLLFSQFDSDFSCLDVSKIILDLGYFSNRLIRMCYNSEKFQEYLDVFDKNRKEFEERYGAISITEYDIEKYRYFWWVCAPYKHY